MLYSNAALGFNLAGIASSAIGSYWSARQSKVALKSQADMAKISGHISDTNARIAEMAAQQELYRGNTEVADVTRAAGQMKGRQRATLAASGVDLGEGSAAEIQASTDLMKEMDVHTARSNAIRSAWGYRLQGAAYGIAGTNERNQGLIDRAQEGAISPGLSATSSLMGSVGQVASSWYALNGGSPSAAPTSIDYSKWRRGAPTV